MQDTALDIMFKNTLKGTLRKLPSYAHKMLGNGSFKTISALCDIMQFSAVCVLFLEPLYRVTWSILYSLLLLYLEIWMQTVINTTLEYTDCFLVVEFLFILQGLSILDRFSAMILKDSKMTDKIQCRLTLSGACWAK